MTNLQRMTKADLIRRIQALEQGSSTVGHAAAQDRRRTKQALRESEERFRAVAENLGDGLVLTDLDDTILDVNPRLLEMAGYARDEIIGRKGYDVLNSPEQQEEIKGRNAERAAGRSGHYEILLRRKDGSRFWAEITGAPVRDAQGRIFGTVGLLRDITERKQAQEILEQTVARRTAALTYANEALRASEERLRQVLEASQTGTFEVNLETGEGHWNAVEYELLGLQPGDATPVPETFFRRVHPEDAGWLRAQWEEAKRTGQYDAEFRIVRPDGQERWLGVKGRFFVEPQSSGTPFRTGRPTRFLGVNFDITERKLAEQERHKFVSLAENSSDFIGMCDRDFTPFYVNAAGLRLVGLKNLEAGGHIRMPTFFFPEDEPFLRQEFVPRLLRDGRGEVEIRFRHCQTGAAIWMLCNVFPLRDTAGATTGWASVGHDITERRRLESELLAISEREQRRIGHDLHDGLGQQLTALEMQCFLLREDLAAQDVAARRKQLRAQAGQMSQALRECITTTRSLARGLVPVDLKEDGLMGALKQLAHRTDLAGPIECRLICRVPVTVLNSQTAKHLYHIAQEAVNNALKHARAGRIDLHLARRQGVLRLQIKDDGRGLPKRRKGKSGMGLEIMRHRAHVIGAGLEIESKPGQGVSVTCTMPMMEA